MALNSLADAGHRLGGLGLFVPLAQVCALRYAHALS